MTKPTESLTLREVRRRTGLTARALRFYEDKGLVTPVRSYNGARLYGPGELERLHKVLVLRKAGLTLDRIGALLGANGPGLEEILAAQLATLREQATRLAGAIASLELACERVRCGGPVDVVTLCDIIKTGESTMDPKAWKNVADRFYTPEEQARWAEQMARVPSDFDPGAYQRQWQELAARIESALPLEPGSDRAQALLDEWTALLAPFTAVATPEMLAGATRLYDRMDEWSAKGGMPQAPFSKAVWEFVQAAGQARAKRT